jgi:hypothetical protein
MTFGRVRGPSTSATAWTCGPWPRRVRRDRRGRPRASTTASGLRDAFHDPRHGARFVVRRAALRTVLARYVGAAGGPAVPARGRGAPATVAPAADLVERGRRRRPRVVRVARRDLLGIDVERLREVPEHAEIAARYLAADDAAAVAAATDEPARRLAFFRGWTRLEALSKALDGGVYRHVERRTAAGPRVAEGGIEPLLFTPRPPFVRAGETSPPTDFVAAATDARGPRRVHARAERLSQSPPAARGDPHARGTTRGNSSSSVRARTPGARAAITGSPAPRRCTT